MGCAGSIEKNVGRFEGLKYRMSVLNIIKIGGNVIDNPEQLEEFLEKFSALPGRKILVHGGG